MTTKLIQFCAVTTWVLIVGAISLYAALWLLGVIASPARNSLDKLPQQQFHSLPHRVAMQ